MIRHSLFDFFGLNETVISAENGELVLEKRKITDFLCQYGANPFGGVDKRLTARIVDFFSQDNAVLCQPLQANYASLLKARLLNICGFTEGDALLTQSGAETVELAVKIARAVSGKPFTIALSGAFHGKTTGAIQLTANEDYCDYFGVKNSFVRRLDVGQLLTLDHSFESLISDGQVNAVIVEVVQGEGGMIELTPEWLQHLEILCRKAGILFIVDEIQTGLGRTGYMLAADKYALSPDMVLLSKALGGGIVPIGACVLRAGLMPPDFTIFHSSTFANNNFTSFVSNEALILLQDALPTARKAGEYLGTKLAELTTRNADVFSGHSGIGLMRGLHLQDTHDSESLLATFQWNSGLRSYAISAWLLREHNMLSMPCFSKPSCLRLQPPLTATKTHIDKGIEALEALASLLRAPEVDLALMGEVVPMTSNSIKTTPRKIAVQRNSQRQQRRFQFNMHPLHDWSFLSSMPEGINSMGAAAQTQYIQRIHKLNDIFSGFGAECYTIPEFTLGDTYLEGRLFGVNLTANQMMSLSSRERQKVQQMIIKSATSYGADVVGLGAFTSIILNPGLRRLDSGASVTAGSSLTAYSAIHSALTTPALTTPQHYGVVGASGSVGALCTQMLILAATSQRNVDKLTLFFNPQNPNGLRNLSKSLLRSVDGWSLLEDSSLVDKAGAMALREIAQLFKIQTTLSSAHRLDQTPDLLNLAISQILGRTLLDIRPSDDYTVLKKIDRLLLATNATTELSAIHHCRSGAWLYDVGMPASVGAEMLRDGAVQAVTAGILRAPEDWVFGRGNMVELPPGVILGCFAETMTLAATDPTAAPAGINIHLAEAERIGKLALSVGMIPTTCPISKSLCVPMAPDGASL